MSELQDEVASVIGGGYCVGCGACAGAMADDGLGRNVPLTVLQPAACPFTSGPDEDALARPLFGDLPRHPDLGHFRAAYVGHVEEGDYRLRGSSGGFAKWLLAELLRRGIVDAVVQVYATGRAGQLFEYRIATDEAAVRDGSTSAYYPVPMHEVLAEIRRREGRYAVVGVPCYIKALRRLCQLEPELQQRLTVTVGLLCGQMKSKAYAELAGWQMGVRPDDLTSIEFRGKYHDRSPYHFRTTAVGGGRMAEADNKSLFGLSSWAAGVLKLRACEFCDDVWAETADIAVGDAWIEPFREEPRGTNVVVVRDRRLDALIASGIEEGRLAFMPVSADRANRSQRGALRHRRREIGYRLWWTDRSGAWRPVKRVPARSRLRRVRQAIQRARLAMATESHTAFAAARAARDLDGFLTGIRPLAEQADSK